MIDKKTNLRLNIFLTIFFLVNTPIAHTQTIAEGDFEPVEGYTVQCGHEDINGSYHYWRCEFSNWALYRKTSFFSVKRWRNCGYLESSRGIYCPCCGTHSPDIWDSSLGPSKGHGYFMRIGAYELIQQDFFGSFEEGKFYKVKFRMYVDQYDIHSGDKLQFMLAKHKVKYKRVGYEASEPVDDICLTNAVWERPTNNKYKEYKTLNNDIRTIKEYDLTSVVTDEWINLEFSFTMFDQGVVDKHNWFVIDVTEDGDGDGYMYYPFAYIDDISVEEAERCNLEEPCSPTDGYIQRNVLHHISNENSNYIIDGLENVSLAKNMKIVNASGDEIVSLPNKYCQNGIDYIHWDGRGSGGDELASGWYAWKMDLENDCDTKHYDVVFILPHMGGRPALPDNFECNQSVTQAIPCCEAEPNIFIDNEIIQGSGAVSYHAINNITISNTIIKSSATNVTFKAGNEIILNTGFETEQGANVDMIIEPCDNKQVQKRDSLYEKEIFNDILVSDIEVSEEETIINNNIEQNNLLFQILPNPANDYINISLSFSGKKCCSCDNYNIISITDISGKRYYRENILGNEVKIDVSNFPAGIYFVNITGKGFSETKKLIVQ